MPRTTRRLVGLNIVLLAVLAIVTLASTPRLFAQPGGGAGAQNARPRGDYTMVSSRYQGSSNNAVYILDAANQELAVLKWDRGKERFEPIGLRRLSQDAGQFQGAR